MKTKFLLPFLLVFGACENSDPQLSQLPDSLIDFKASDQAQVLENEYPGYSTSLKYGDYWMETINGEQVYAVPAKDGDQLEGVLYVGSDLRALC